MNEIKTLKAIVTENSEIMSYNGSDVSTVSFVDSYTNTESSESLTYNSPTPLDKNLMVSPKPDVRNYGDETTPIINKENLELNGVAANSVLENIYNDTVRGNVILSKMYDCSYRIATYRKELIVSNVNDIINHEPQYSFTWSEGARNLLENPFAGMNLESGCTISAWVLVPSYHALTNRSALFTFLGEQVHLEHPNVESRDGIKNDVITQPFFTIEANANVYFAEAYMNLYSSELTGANSTYAIENPPYRKSLGRRWEHFIISIEDSGVCVYINGVKIEHDVIYKGKRFDGGNGDVGNSGMMKLTEFIAKEDTNLFLGLTLLNAEGKCDYIRYDDITFYDEAVSPESASQIYQSAISSSLGGV